MRELGQSGDEIFRQVAHLPSEIERRGFGAARFSWQVDHGR
jgi:hypothetical protein